MTSPRSSLPSNYYSNRRKNLLPLLTNAGVEALLVSCPFNLTYLSGFQGQDSWAIISPKGSWLVTDSRYLEQAQIQAKGFNIVLRDKTSVFEVIRDITNKNKFKRVGVESHSLTQHFFESLQAVARQCRLRPVGGLIEKLREQKDLHELKLIQKAIDIAIDAFLYIKSVAKPGLSENQIQADFEYHAKKSKASKSSFDVIVAAGRGSSMPHYVTSDKKTGINQPLLVDMGVVFGGYCSDLTRNLFFGKIPPSYLKAYEAVLEAQAAAINMAGPGVACKIVDRACRSVLEKAGFGGYFGHGTGHGVGLQVHESPSVSSRSETILKEGMVVTIEPGVYIPGRFGIRIEDMILITPNGRRVLSARLGKSLHELLIR